ncbi:hypothetical protein PTSG_13162 [Salpingoeca rosetta]|uniref:Uncharacterized protein n=1 Tax=Salpingoeca rosetta (strain ATCC 50818 / BSB-021) TaxID=946362 RepID=F2USV8_SALR5|nr:uncharacterized protein PTSG_13162 [Salpingoeca rosetta]EGD81217.1 hypothetical protein PTSG_13162 [Salpingoeca rosetta]|eukprot:XP_004987751.1 hypothetical protein PTSG_13162 [Salpingoeca rosetta]
MRPVTIMRTHPTNNADTAPSSLAFQQTQCLPDPHSTTSTSTSTSMDAAAEEVAPSGEQSLLTTSTTTSTSTTTAATNATTTNATPSSSTTTTTAPADPVESPTPDSFAYAYGIDITDANLATGILWAFLLDSRLFEQTMDDDDGDDQYRHVDDRDDQEQHHQRMQPQHGHEQGSAFGFVNAPASPSSPAASSWQQHVMEHLPQLMSVLIMCLSAQLEQQEQEARPLQATTSPTAAMTCGEVTPPPAHPQQQAQSPSSPSRASNDMDCSDDGNVNEEQMQQPVHAGIASPFATASLARYAAMQRQLEVCAQCLQCGSFESLLERFSEVYPAFPFLCRGPRPATIGPHIPIIEVSPTQPIQPWQFSPSIGRQAALIAYLGAELNLWPVAPAQPPSPLP